MFFPASLVYPLFNSTNSAGIRTVYIHSTTYFLFLYSKTAVVLRRQRAISCTHTSRMRRVVHPAGCPGSVTRGRRRRWQLSNRHSGDLLPTLRVVYQACVPRSPELLEIVKLTFTQSEPGAAAPAAAAIQDSGDISEGPPGICFSKGVTDARAHTHTQRRRR